MTGLADRFATARLNAPLSALSEPDRRELDVLLRDVDAFEDLPGRWQAALLTAEAPGADEPPRHCCGGH